MMAGARRQHDRIVVNAITALNIRLAGSSGEPFTADGAVETMPGQIRRPDVGVDCGPTKADGLLATDPRVIIEVLSTSARDFDRMRKFAEYQAMATLRHILFVQPDVPVVYHWFRADEDTPWSALAHTGLKTVIDLHAIAIKLPMAELYTRVLD